MCFSLKLEILKNVKLNKCGIVFHSIWRTFDDELSLWLQFFLQLFLMLQALPSEYSKKGCKRLKAFKMVPLAAVLCQMNNVGCQFFGLTCGDCFLKLKKTENKCSVLVRVYRTDGHFEDALPIIRVSLIWGKNTVAGFVSQGYHARMATSGSTYLPWYLICKMGGDWLMKSWTYQFYHEICKSCSSLLFPPSSSPLWALSLWIAGGLCAYSLKTLFLHWEPWAQCVAIWHSALSLTWTFNLYFSSGQLFGAVFYWDWSWTTCNALYGICIWDCISDWCIRRWFFCDQSL